MFFKARYSKFILISFKDVSDWIIWQLDINNECRFWIAFFMTGCFLFFLYSVYYGYWYFNILYSFMHHCNSIVEYVSGGQQFLSANRCLIAAFSGCKEIPSSENGFMNMAERQTASLLTVMKIHVRSRLYGHMGYNIDLQDMAAKLPSSEFVRFFKTNDTIKFFRKRCSIIIMFSKKR